MKRYDLVATPFNQIFDSFFADKVPAFNTSFYSEPQNKWAQFAVKEQENGFAVKAELAGVKKEDLKIEILGDTLKISGSRGSKEEKAGLLDYSEFTKSFTLGTGIDTDKIEAKFENGYLNLLIPKAEAQKSRLIDVK